uniref:Heat shock protein family A member 12 variant X7 n=1 Tax=Urechis unicinctus TaxID=6432 RepID=A0AAU0MVK8_UREUN
MQHLSSVMADGSMKELSDSFHKQNKEHVLVAAIDFGTTYSGYAFSFTVNKDDIRMFSKWGNVLGVPMSFKTPTVVLTKNAGNEFVDFGYGALHAYSNLEEDELEDYSIYEKFKMYLHKTKNLGSKTYITAKKGLNASALSIFSHGLRYLSDHLLETIKDQTGSKPGKDLIRWVITVPAIWSDGSKQFMRQAALKAGIIDTMDSQSLVIALEPEAASLYCRQLDVHHLLSTNKDESKMPVGTKYLVLDCGGGTLDVTVHHLRDFNKVAELYQATGSDLGGSKVDDNFIELLKNVLGADVVDAYQNESPADWLNMMSSFEQKKRVVDPRKSEKTNISISAELGTIYMEVKGENIKKAISPEWKSKGMSVANGVLRIPHETMLGVFAPIVSAVVDHVKDLMKIPQVRDTTHILVVGGFGESPVLQSALRDEFEGTMKIIVPADASHCVMKGATLFGHNPSAIVSRRSRKTYGTDVYPIFDPTKHDPGKTKMYGDKRRAEGLFRTWIKQGEEVQMGKALTFSHVPVTPDQTNMSIGLFCSELNDPRYCSDTGVDQLGNITVQLPGSGLDRRVEVKIMFGGTEITVEGRDCRPGGSSAKTTVNFLSD